MIIKNKDSYNFILKESEPTLNKPTLFLDHWMLDVH